MGRDNDCTVLCTKKVTKDTVDNAKWLIENDYRVEWIIDNLPGATAYHTIDGGQRQYEAGFKLGVYDEETKKSYLHNHITMMINYERKEGEDGAKLITGFEVYPYSVDGPEGSCPEHPEDSSVHLSMEEYDQTITYSYSVYWREPDGVTWGNRWDMYLTSSQADPQIHWYSIINSLIIALFLTAMVGIILLRTLNRDIALYNEEDLKLAEEQEDTTGWKLVHGDVFRPPKYAGLFAPVIGSGMQILMMTVLTMMFSIFGILNPSYRGGFVSFALFLFVFSGAFAGYVSARIYKVFKGTAWVKNAVLTAFLVPGVLFAIIIFLNLFIWAQNSSTAIPLGTIIALVLMWFGISLPLVVVGGYFGSKAKVIEHPVRTNQIPRQIPEQIWYLRPFVSVTVGGLMPFAVIFIELFFILKSIWQTQFYYMFGFLGLVLMILIVTVVEITIVITYFQLCGEDYQWWWRSFFVGASSAAYIFLYTVFYFITRLKIDGFVSGLVFFTYSFVACAVYGLLTGTLGWLAAYAFVFRIYGAIKAD